MTVLCCRLALCAILFAALSARARDKEVSPDPPVDRAAELRRNAGTYHVIHFERDGVPTAAVDLKAMKVILNKDGNGEFHVGTEVHTSFVTPFPDKKPREMDCEHTNGTAKGMVVRGIYKVEGDRMTCCFGPPGGARPKEFRSVPGTGQVLYTIQRVKEK